MDIKTKINTLSEDGAKAALMGCVDLLSANIHCSDCINGVDVGRSIMPCGEAQKCKSYWLAGVDSMKCEKVKEQIIKDWCKDRSVEDE